MGKTEDCYQHLLWTFNRHQKFHDNLFVQKTFVSALSALNKLHTILSGDPDFLGYL